MRRLKIAIGMIAIIAILQLPITCICQLMRVDGLYAMPPHLLIFGHEHNEQVVAAVQVGKGMAGMVMGQMLMDGVFDRQPTIAAAQPTSMATLTPIGCSMAQHGGPLTDLNPILVATLPPLGRLPQASLAASQTANSQPAIAQYSPAPPTPPPPLALAQADSSA